MDLRNFSFALLGSGTLLGTIGGLSIDTAMKSPPDPPWRQLASYDPSTDESYRFVDAGTQDLSPYSDRIPTWKRRGALSETVFVSPAYPEYAEGNAILTSEAAVVDLPETALPAEALQTMDAAGAADAAVIAASTSQVEITSSSVSENGRGELNQNSYDASTQLTFD